MSTSEPVGEVHHYSAEAIEVSWSSSRCLHFAECVRGLPRVFDPTGHPWVRPGNAAPTEVAAVIRRCPTGALQYRSAVEPDEFGEALTDVHPTPWGPVLLRGRLEVHLGDGAPRSETRMALCACERTSRTPYCDGSCRAG